MLTIKQIRDDMQAAARRLAKKGVDAAPVIEKIVALDDRRKAIQVELDTTLAAQNKAAHADGLCDFSFHCFLFPLFLFGPVRNITQSGA